MLRFFDENYLNWLKTTESLNALRVGLRSFLENETETYHGSLKRKFSASCKDAVCRIKCDGKQWQNKKADQIPKCEVCTRWKALILANHKSASGYGVYWKECFPHLWPTEKWEVAKVYMPQGHRDHRCFDQFDIASLMVLMSNCKHFRSFVKEPQHIDKVTRVRNCVMHSPDFTLVQDDFQLFLSTIKTFALLLQDHASDLKTLPQEIDKICEEVDKGFKLQRPVPQAAKDEVDREREGEDLEQSYALVHKCMEMEQKALKEKIEYLTQRCQDDQEGVKEELEGIWNFLAANRDLRDKMVPQVQQLQQVVEQHGLQINQLNLRVDQLEDKVTQGGDIEPVFSGAAPKYKNHVFELARDKRWEEPEFSETREGVGYRGVLQVNGCVFEGRQVCLNKKQAHQEVAKMALPLLQDMPPGNDSIGWARSHSGQPLSLLAGTSLPALGCSPALLSIEAPEPSAASSSASSGRPILVKNVRVVTAPLPLPHTAAVRGSEDTHPPEYTHPPPPEPRVSSRTEDSVKAGSPCFYGSVTVQLVKEVCVEGRSEEKEALQEAYGELAPLCGLEGNDDTSSGLSKRDVVLEYFRGRGFPVPSELVPARPDGKFDCQLKLSGPLTFHSQASSSKKQAEHRAAKRALEQLGGVLGCSSVSSKGENYNYKGALQERLMALKMEKPTYHIQDSNSSESGAGAVIQPEPGAGAVVQSVPTSRAVVQSEPTSGAVIQPEPGAGAVVQSVPTSGAVVQSEPTSRAVVQSVPTSRAVVQSEPTSGAVIQPEPGAGAVVQSHPSMKESAGQQNSSSASVGVTGSRFFGSVTMLLNMEVAEDIEEEEMQEEAQEETQEEKAYRTLARQLDILHTSHTGSCRLLVERHFAACGFPLPLPQTRTRADGTTHCTLTLSGAFTCADQEGSSRAKQAEQRAAKRALEQLGGVLGCSSVSSKGENYNYKGALQERLMALKMEIPTYHVIDRGVQGGSSTAVSLLESSPARCNDLSPPLEVAVAPGSNEQPAAAQHTPAAVKPTQLQSADPAEPVPVEPVPVEPVPVVSCAPVVPVVSCAPVVPVVSCAASVVPVTSTTGSISTAGRCKQARVQFEVVERLLELKGLLPPVVVIEKCSVEHQLTARVQVELRDFSFHCPAAFPSKKEASRKAFHCLALAAGICTPQADETYSIKEVKQFFAQRKLPCPKEVVQEKEKTFSCSLTEVSCCLAYEGQGSFEAAARQAACLEALSKLGPLLLAGSGPSRGGPRGPVGGAPVATVGGPVGVLGAPDSEGAEQRLCALLNRLGQPAVTCSVASWRYMAWLTLALSGFTLQHDSCTNRKQAQNYLCERILKILDIDTDCSTSGSLRNSLDDWFKKRGLPAPSFTPLEGTLGVRASFSAPLTSSSTGWQDSCPEAEKSLVQELTRRLEA